jgi:hypothetical protein
MPTQTGSSKIAMMSLIHFGTRGRIQNSVFRSQKKPLRVLASFTSAGRQHSQMMQQLVGTTTLAYNPRA